jgi:nicotinamide riboside kinase
MAAQHEVGLVLCVTGPESTGKTTLARDLAAALTAPLVEEVARAYLAGGGGAARIRQTRTGYTRDDVLTIARLQLAAEQAALATGAPLVVADTDLTVIQVWWEARYGPLDPWLSAALAARSPRCYLLATPDLPWEPDPLRESPHDRDRLLLRYRAVLADTAFRTGEISGRGAARLDVALALVNRWLAAPE